VQLVRSLLFRTTIAGLPEGSSGQWLHQTSFSTKTRVFAAGLADLSARPSRLRVA
jgi:hypothetical protein